MVVATKGRFPMGSGPNDIGISRRHLSHALDDSLARLGVEQIDLYQMHAWDALTPIEETLRFLDDAVSVLEPDARIGVISFHSLEDRIVKRAFRRLGGECTCPPGLPVCACGRQELLSVLTSRPVTACRGRRRS